MTTTELTLRPLTLSDANERYLSWLNDPIVTKYLETKSSTMDELVAYVKKHLANENCRLLGIFDAKKDVLIGTLKFDPIDWKAKSGQFAMMIGDRSYWGQGLGTLSTRLGVEYAFKELGLSQVNLGVIDTNEAAIRAYHKVGFKDVSHERTVTRNDGSAHGAIDMVLMRDEFEKAGA